jgi:hypothetical protein
MFLQGTETITLSGGTYTGVIADQSGSGGTGPDAGKGTIDVTAGSTVNLDAVNTFTGGVNLRGGARSNSASRTEREAARSHSPTSPR